MKRKFIVFFILFIIMLCSYNKNALDDNINKVSTSENIKEENKTIEEEKEPIMVAVNYQNDTKK